MSAWAAKRFWKAATVEACEGGFTIRLDARPVKTPAKQPLVLPTLAMAQALAVEWDAQDGVIKPETMPLTRAANSSIDKVVPNFEAVVDELAGYGGSDLLCYRAEGPEPLVARQAAGWDPLLAWAKDVLHAPLNVTAGVIPVAQPAESVQRLRAHVARHSAFHLAALHDLVAITGSLVLALAVARGHLTAEQAFALSRIDETWQAEQWGEDEEAARAEAVRKAALLDAERFYGLSG
jgi:chaperone required for assembly of F1-ATPase